MASAGDQESKTTHSSEQQPELTEQQPTSRLDQPAQGEEQPAATVEKTSPSKEQPPALPDYLTDPDAVSKDVDAAWRYGKPPDYTNTRNVWKASLSLISPNGTQ